MSTCQVDSLTFPRFQALYKAEREENRLALSPTEAVEARVTQARKNTVAELEEKIDRMLRDSYDPNRPFRVHIGLLERDVVLALGALYRAAGWKIDFDHGYLDLKAA